MLSRGVRKALLYRSFHVGEKSWIRTLSKFAYPEGMKAYEDEYTDKPDYPPIVPELRNMRRGLMRLRKEELEWRAAIRDGGTVEEKLIMLNMKRRYGWRATKMEENDFGYNCTPYFSFVTRTHMVEGNTLPEIYSSPELCERSKAIAEKIKEPLKDLLRFELEGIQRRAKEDFSLWPQEVELAETTSVVNQINRLLVALLAQEAPHLQTCQVDHMPKLAAFWSCGGLEPPKKIKKLREHLKDFHGEIQGEVNDPVERNFQYYGSSILQIRTKNPISNFVDAESDLTKRGDSIPDRMPYMENNYGLKTDMKFATCLNGHWLGDGHRCSVLSIHPQHHLRLPHKQTQYWIEDASSALDSQAILACFGRMLAQAYNHGFDQFTDIDYPFSTQFVSTNGIDWSFYAYQLNTTHLDSRNIKSNTKQNILWGTQPRKILDENNELNAEVVETLIKFYLNPPSPISSSKASPTPHIADTLEKMEDPRKREFIFENLRDMYRHKNIHHTKHPFPEIYDWERIYKIKFKTMPLDARRRWFTLPKGFPGSDPYNEPYKLRDPQNVPRALTFYRKQLAEKKDQDRFEEARKAEKEKFDRGFDPSEE